MKRARTFPVIPLTIFAVSALTGIACTDDSDSDTSSESNGDVTGDETAGTDMDGGDTETVTLSFQARINGADFGCGEATGLGTTDETVSIEDLRFFISDVQLLQGGTAVDAPIVDDGNWAQPRVALLDFESRCGDAGSEGTNAEVEVEVPAGTYDGLVFQLGVPFDLNHVDAQSPDAAAPLNTASMFWSWQGGYKFFRLDMKTGADGTTPWNVHLGSTMCMSDSAVTPPTMTCGRPNLPTIRLEGVDVATTPITLDIGTLLTGTDLSQDTMDSPPGCISMPPDAPECTDLFGKLGLDFATGECVNGCAGQVLFSAG